MGKRAKTRYVFPMPDRIVAVGDIEGHLDVLALILRAAGLVAKSGRWTGGGAHLVQMGDIFGRGADPRGCCDMLRRLAREARRSGGRVHVLLGNHEAEVVHRYEFDCDPREYLSFANASSLRRWVRERAEAAAGAWTVHESSSLPIRNLVGAWELLHPPGRGDFRKAVSLGGVYGGWMASLPVAVKIGPLLFSHAGILPPWADGGPGALDEDRSVTSHLPADRAASVPGQAGSRGSTAGAGRPFGPIARINGPSGSAELAEVRRQRTVATDARDVLAWLNERAGADMAVDAYFSELPPASMLLADGGPLWTRRLAWGGRGVREELFAVLRKLGASAQVVGHTPTENARITQRYARRVVCIDTGIGRPGSGRPSALVVEDGTFFALYPPAGPKPLRSALPAPRRGRRGEGPPARPQKIGPMPKPL